MTKYVDLKGLQSFKTKQDAEISVVYAAKTSIPTKVSALANDSGYQTSTQVSNTISALLANYSKTGHTHAISDITDLQKALDGKASTSHTHSYAGSASAGGSATSAVKLDTSAGSATQPIYFSNGKPVATTYALNKTVPSNAVFTDTTYSAATTSAAGLMSASDKSKLDGIAKGANNYTYTLPTASSSTLGGVKTTSTVTSNSGYTACPIISGVPYYKNTNTTYSAATTSAAGLMSAADKTKLDGINSISTTEIDALWA